MVHVVLAKVVLGKVRDIRLLDMRNVGWVQSSNIHLERITDERSTSQILSFVVVDREV